MHPLVMIRTGCVGFFFLCLVWLAVVFLGGLELLAHTPVAHLIISASLNTVNHSLPDCFSTLQRGIWLSCLNLSVFLLTFPFNFASPRLLQCWYNLRALAPQATSATCTFATSLFSTLDPPPLVQQSLHVSDL